MIRTRLGNESIRSRIDWRRVCILSGKTDKQESILIWKGVRAGVSDKSSPDDGDWRDGGCVSGCGEGEAGDDSGDEVSRVKDDPLFTPESISALVVVKQQKCITNTSYNSQ